MGQTSVSNELTIAELEDRFPLYRSTLRILIRERKTIEQIQRSLCWQRLACLHQSLPGRYDDPSRLYGSLRREILA